MSLKPILTFARGFAVGCLALFALTKPADAAYWQGDFDPPFLYQGFAIFDVPLSCYRTTVDYVVAGTGLGQCGAVDFVTATVTSDPSQPYDTITWSLAVANAVQGILWDPTGATILGIDMWPPVGPSSLPSTGAYFGSNTYFLSFYSGALLPPPPPPPGVNLYIEVCNGCQQGTASIIGFRQVPEPGALALLAVALIAAAFVGQRRTLRSRHPA